MKVNLRKLLLILMELLIILMIGEILARKFLPQKTFGTVKKMSLQCYKSSVYLPYEYIPNCKDEMEIDGRMIEVGINEIGLRGKEIGSKTKKRILFAGDSFVFGYGVSEDERIGELLERALGNTEVVSAGFVGDAGPDTAYLYTLKEGLNLSPDLILLSIFPYNDLSDIEKTIWEMQDGEIKSTKMPDRKVVNGYLRRSDTPWKYKIPLLRDSHLFQFVFDRVDVLTLKLRRKISLRFGLIQTAVEDHEKFRNCLYKNICEGKWNEAEFKTEKIFQLVKQLSIKNNIQVLPVIIPLKEQIFGSEQTDTLFHQILRRDGIEFLDLSQAFRDSGQLGDDLYLADGHWTAKGHEVAAKAVAGWLQILRLSQSD